MYNVKYELPQLNLYVAEKMLTLKSYIENSIIPKYDNFDMAHRRSHAISVIERSIKLAKMLGADWQISYAAAAFHDLGLEESRETHHLSSGRIIRKDRFLPLWFNAEQIETIAQAAEDHRASSKNPPRSIYGKILAEADRDLTPEIVIKRCVLYEISHNAGLPMEEQMRNVVQHLQQKYGRHGYIKLYIPVSENEIHLKAIWKMLDSNEAALTAVRKAFFAVRQQQ